MGIKSKSRKRHKNKKYRTRLYNNPQVKENERPSNKTKENEQPSNNEDIRYLVSPEVYFQKHWRFPAVFDNFLTHLYDNNYHGCFLEFNILESEIVEQLINLISPLTQSRYEFFIENDDIVLCHRDRVKYNIFPPKEGNFKIKASIKSRARIRDRMPHIVCS
ncbi:MAG: hypothetical protein F6K22_22650 [Okeania sp. SIO2F4]|uniref:hypothetical protein n=1 Tax=Okeania sp. SIO2F4 TaxID=2607790 RepID=UPI00142D0850|nr:hypothetical protein [Okeania sp. SIO2F4]NES05373.1 hypothetical protein [Okeania sp. SIO2F4]